MKLVKYFLQKKSVTILLLILVLGGGLFSYIKMGKLEDAPFTIKQALVMTPYPGASPSEVQSQVTDVLEESIQSLGELYYLKTENRAGLSKITVYVKKEIRADEMQQLWDKLRRKVNDVQSKLPAGAGPSVVNDDFGDVLGVFYGLTGEGYSYRELENQAKCYYLSTSTIYHSSTSCSACAGKNTKKSTVQEIKKIRIESGKNKGKRKYRPCSKCWIT